MWRNLTDVDFKKFDSESVRNYPDANTGTVPRASNVGNFLAFVEMFFEDE